MQTSKRDCTDHSQGKGNTNSVKGDRGVFSPCTDCTHDQRKNLIFCLMKGYFLPCIQLKSPPSPPCTNIVTRAVPGMIIQVNNMEDFQLAY